MAHALGLPVVGRLHDAFFAGGDKIPPNVPALKQSVAAHQHATHSAVSCAQQHGLVCGQHCQRLGGERDAVQGDSKGREAIRSRKADLWKDKAPKKVAFSDLKITPRRDGYVVTFVQDYESRDGGSDRGKKTLYLAPSGNGFAIVEEKWSRM